jgi:hypothetical protein
MRNTVGGAVALVALAGVWGCSSGEDSADAAPVVADAAMGGGGGGGSGGRGQFPDGSGFPEGGSAGASNEGGTPGSGGDAAGGAAGGAAGVAAGGSAAGGSSAGGAGGAGFPSDAGAPDAFVIPTGPMAADHCTAATPIPMTAPRIDLMVNTAGATHDVAGPCGAGDADAFFSFTLDKRSVVYADTFGASWNTVVYFAASCAGEALADNSDACNDDACGTPQSQATAVLAPGKYILGVTGPAGQSGAATVHFEHAPVGRGPATLLAAGTTTVMGMLSGTGSLFQCDAAGADNSYYWAGCPGAAGGAFMAGTCDGAAFDTVLSLNVPRTNAAICADDGCKFQSLLTTALPPGAGLNVLTVDSSTPVNAGPYTLTVSRPQ